MTLSYFIGLLVWGVILLYGFTYIVVDADLTQPVRDWLNKQPAEKHFLSRIRNFFGRIAVCWYCTSAWVSIPLFWTLILLYICLQSGHWMAYVLTMLLLPPTAVGCTVWLMYRSPKVAADGIIDVGISIAQSLTERRAAVSRPKPQAKPKETTDG